MSDSPAQRADAVVALRLGISVRAARRLFEDGGVRLQGRRVDKGARIDPGADLQIEGQDRAREAVLQPRAMDLSILYHDDALIVVDKPAGLPSHPLRAGESDTVAAGIVARFPECAQASLDAREGGLAHRLDTGTSGVIVAARTRAVWEALRQTLSSGQCTKTYLATVVGTPPAQWSVDAAIGRGGPRGGFAMVESGRNPLPARTDFVCVSQFAHTALVRATLSAGRIHQVRVHLSHSGYPVLGDPQYADGSALVIAEQLGVDAIQLHAESIAFSHPVDGRRLRVEAPLPPWAAIA